MAERMHLIGMHEEEDLQVDHVGLVKQLCCAHTNKASYDQDIQNVLKKSFLDAAYNVLLGLTVRHPF
jgi:hypothetical protein